jgi:hypothetical protein
VALGAERRSMSANSDKFAALRREWDAAQTIADLEVELDDPRELTPESIAIRELERGFPLAVQSLVSLSLHSSDERVRRGAANDVINHNLALMQSRLAKNPNADPLMQFMKTVTKEVVADAKKQVEASKNSDDKKGEKDAAGPTSPPLPSASPPTVGKEGAQAAPMTPEAWFAQTNQRED